MSAMSTAASSTMSKEQWLAFADRLIALAYAIFGEAKIEITAKLFGEPKILSVALLCRTVGNFKGVVALTRVGLCCRSANSDAILLRERILHGRAGRTG
jgi:hypothetical protein